MPALASAAPGDLDVSFSGDGKQTTDFGGADLASAVAVQADGKLVVAGTSDGNFALARYGVDGALDPSFSGDGLVTTDIGGTDDGQGVAIQADGKIVVVGGSERQLRAGPVHRRRRARPVVQRRRPADDRLRRRRRRDRGGAPGRRPDRGRRGLRRRFRAGTLRPRRAGSTRRSAAMASRPPTSVGRLQQRRGDRRRRQRSSPWARSRSPMAVRGTSPWPATPRAVRSTDVQRWWPTTTDFGRSQSTYDSGEGVAIQPDGRIVAVGYGAESDPVRWLLHEGPAARPLRAQRRARSARSATTAGWKPASMRTTLGYGVALEATAGS